MRIAPVSNTWNSFVKHAALAITILLSGIAQSASAQDRGTAEDQTACTPDVFRLCVADVPDEAAILACLKLKVTLLGPDCRRVIAPGLSRVSR